jgi:alkylation response protein AidB-like acyl-CoA dehydrogenase
MIDFALEPELELLRETARQFATEQLRPNEREFEATRSASPSVRRAFQEIGLAAMELPESLGGAGLGAFARALVLEELGAGDPGAALGLDPLGPALYPLLEFGGEAALQRFAAPLLHRPEARALLAWNGEGRLQARGGHVRGNVPWVPRGSVPWVPADRAELLVVLDGEGAWVVEDGFELAPLRGSGLRAAGAAELRLENARVAEWWLDPGAARRALARARLYVASLLVGTMRAAAEFSRDYALRRVAFGRPIAHHQALAFLIADMAASVEGARLLSWEAAARLDRGEAAEERCATAFLEAAEQAMFVTPSALQILGGHGFMQDYPVEKWMREARTLGLLCGGVDAAREDAGQELVKHEAPLDLCREVET